MFPDWVRELTQTQISDYSMFMQITLVVYDYALTFAREVDYIWYRPWTWVSMLFVIVRYVGIAWVFAAAIVGSDLLPMPIKVSAALLLVHEWGYIVFLSAADFLMVLRVYAMWNRSKGILSILLFFYFAQVIVSCVWDGIYETPNRTLSVVIEKTLDSTLCDFHASGPSSIYRAIPRFLLGAVLSILGLIPIVKQAVSMYRLTKHWQMNWYMKLFMREGVLYFVLTLVFNVLSVLTLGPVRPNWFVGVLTGLSDVLMYIIMPHFIIGTRALYDRDYRRGWQGIDSGFGVNLQPTAWGNEASSRIVFADVSPEDHTVEGITTDSEAVLVRGGARQV